MKKIITHLTALLVIVTSTTGCFHKNEPAPQPERTPDSYFNFSTVAKVDINLTYGTPEGYSFFFEIFDQDPLKEITREGGMIDIVRNPAVKAVAKGYTDEKGCYSNSIPIPAVSKKLYVYSTALTVEKMMIIDIVNGVASAPYVPEEVEEPSMTSKIATKAPTKVDGFMTLGVWRDWGKDKFTVGKVKYSVYGRPDYLDNEKKITIPGTTLNAINNAFTDGQPVSKGFFKKTDINVAKEAEIWLYLVDETTANNNVIGYYTYPTGQKPASVSDIKNKIIAIPNARIFANHNNFPKGKHGAMSRGEGVKLQYWDGEKLVPHFPVGVSIGWVLSSDGYRFPRMEASTGISMGYDYFYSHADLNPERSGEKNHLALFKYNDFVVFGFEDYYNNNGDGDCNDVVFHVKSNPVDAITDEIPEVEEPELGPDDEAYTTEYEGTLSFEDLWPYKGDYDMNDVVIKYHSVVSYNKFNEALSTIDTFTLLWSGAAYSNGFAYEMNVDRSNVDVTIENNSGETSEGLINGMDKANIMLFSDALTGTVGNTKQIVYTVKTKFKTRIPIGKFETAPYNPYIIRKSDPTIELHLPGYKPTSKADTKYFGIGQDKSDKEKGIYYVSAEQYPFAINITGSDVFQISPEETKIDETYPKFRSWVISWGKEDADWYKHPKK